MSSTLKTPRKGGHTETVTIAANTFYPVVYEGNSVRCVASTADLSLHIDNTGEPILFATNKAYRLDPGEYFASVMLKNDNAFPVTVTFFVGWGNYTDSAATVSGQVNATIVNTPANPVYTEETTPTGYTSGAATNVANAAYHDIAASAARKLLIIYNDDAGATVWWRDQTGTANAGQPIGPKQTLQIAFAGASRVTNNSGGAVDVYVSEMT